MELRDVIVTPIVLFLVYLVAFYVRPFVTDSENRGYFMLGLSAKIFGALALGFIYQFYYDGGDTYNFHTHGSRHVWEAFWDSPEKGIKLLLSDGTSERDIYKYSARIPFFRDQSSYMVIRLAGLVDLFTFSTYSATAIFFAVFSFIGAWGLFLTFYEDCRERKLWIALATIFVPSVIFWGSGILKDTATLAALGICTYEVKKIFIKKRFNIFSILLLVGALFIIYSIKKYILLCYLPAVLLWVFSDNLSHVRSGVLKIMMLPLIISLTVFFGYIAVVQVGKDDARYNISSLGQTARITAYDIAFQTGRDAGSTYNLGELDGTLTGMIQLAPQAINVSLFRPYLWEVKNPLMLMSALESMILLLLTVYIFLVSFRHLRVSLLNPSVLFCLVFSLTFAFAVGVSTFNFGTLSRYKIPLIPFYLLALVFIFHSSKRARNARALESTE